MNESSQLPQGGWRQVRLTLLLCVLGVFGAPGTSEAHNVLSEFIQHGIQLTVGANHVDLTVDLTFFEEWSARERGVMDADGSGDITRGEEEDYVKQLAPQRARNVKLWVAGRELPLVPLYDPEVDLRADTKVGPAHHRLRLCFFVATPDLSAGDEIVIEDTLWPEAKALATPQAEGRDGCKLTAVVTLDAGLVPARAREEKRLYEFRCLQPPAPRANPVNPPPARQIESVPKPRQLSRTGVAPVSAIGGSGSRASPSVQPTGFGSSARNSEMETGATPVLRHGMQPAHDPRPRLAEPMTADAWRQSLNLKARSTP